MTAEVPHEWVEKAAATLFRVQQGYDGYAAEKPTVRNALDMQAGAVLAAVLGDVRRAVADEVAAAIEVRSLSSSEPFGMELAAAIAREVGERREG